jgi:pyrroline-5-carboxylate reductase
MQIHLTIIGFGTMGQAIASAISKNDKKIKIIGMDKNNPKLPLNIKDVEKSDFIILAVKPQDAKEAINEIKNHINKKTILISIMAGFSIKKINELSNHKKIVRIMPNLGLAVGEGITVWKKSGLSKEENKKIKDLTNKISENFEVKNEDTINKITAISGSGPAYFFILAESLLNACKNIKLNKKESIKLITKTFSSAAILGKDGNYTELIKKVASKGGTTEAALKVLKLNHITKKAVIAAYNRAKELNK